MKISFFSYTFLFVLFYIINLNTLKGQNSSNTLIHGSISLDSTWDSTIYLSYIPTYEKMYEMSNEIIIAETAIDNSGSFEFDIDFLPCDENLFRLHVKKKGDSPATLIIGGKDENHLFLIANCSSKIHITSFHSYPPFRNVTYKNSEVNSAFQLITNLVYYSDSIASESNASKRALIEERLNENLLFISDTSKNALVSLYAIYKNNFETNYSTNSDFYNSYLKKWRNQNNSYFKSFRRQLPDNPKSYLILFFGILLIAILVVAGYYIRKRFFIKETGYQNLSIQERRIFELLRQGATNQEISSHCNIGVSTVKSHVSSIYSKLNIKSRKDILNLKLKTVANNVKHS